VKKKELELRLQKTVSTEIKEYKITYEQYVTPASIASDMLWEAYHSGNIAEKSVLDAGCGTGIFSIGAALLYAKKVIGVDIDAEMIMAAKKNAELFNLDIDLKIADFYDFDTRVDTIIMNPPFGAQLANRKADSLFIKKAISIADMIYSLHMKNSGPYILSLLKEKGWNGFIIREYDFPIPAMYKFHKKPRALFNVICIKASKPSTIFR
jgi:putative methylase